MYAVEIGALILISGPDEPCPRAARRKSRSDVPLCRRHDRGRRCWWYARVSRAASLQHSATFYRVMCMLVPLVIAYGFEGHRAIAGRPPSSAGVYTVLLLGLMWILPLFPAEPKLGPVYYPVTAFRASGFPLLILIPALVLDWLWQRTKSWGAWKAVSDLRRRLPRRLLAVQWPFADFLQSPAARNWIFGSAYFDYLTGPASYQRRYLFFLIEPTAALLEANGDWRSSVRDPDHAPRPRRAATGCARYSGELRRLAFWPAADVPARSPRRQPRHLLRRHGRTVSGTGRHSASGSDSGNGAGRNAQLRTRRSERSTSCRCRSPEPAASCLPLRIQPSAPPPIRTSSPVSCG